MCFFRKKKQTIEVKEEKPLYEKYGLYSDDLMPLVVDIATTNPKLEGSDEFGSYGIGALAKAIHDYDTSRTEQKFLWEYLQRLSKPICKWVPGVLLDMSRAVHLYTMEDIEEVGFFSELVYWEPMANYGEAEFILKAACGFKEAELDIATLKNENGSFRSYKEVELLVQEAMRKD